MGEEGIKGEKGERATMLGKGRNKGGIREEKGRDKIH